jgi:hypothetical protein
MEQRRASSPEADMVSEAFQQGFEKVCSMPEGEYVAISGGLLQKPPIPVVRRSSSPPRRAPGDQSQSGERASGR